MSETITIKHNCKDDIYLLAEDEWPTSPLFHIDLLQAGLHQIIFWNREAGYVRLTLDNASATYRLARPENDIFPGKLVYSEGPA